MIFTYLKREENSLSSEVLPAAQLKANVVVLVNVLQLKLGNTDLSRTQDLQYDVNIRESILSLFVFKFNSIFQECQTCD